MPINEGFEIAENEVTNSNTVDDLKNRETWSNSVHFLMYCIAMSVGLGNIWRFPFTAYENGGGAFLVPYLIILILVGRPIYFLEMCLGQFCSKGNLKTFECLVAILRGVAFGQIFGSVIATTYYCSLMAITLFYLYHSFTLNLPWAECSPEWENDSITCIPSNVVNMSNFTTEKFSSSSELWFTREVLKEKTQIYDGIGLPDWRLTIFLFISWALIFVLSSKGIRTSGKASYFLALFPYVILLILLTRAVTLEGSAKGVLYFLNPQWEKLLKAKVWYSAITQCFFSLNIGSGIITTFASYNNFKHDIYRDAWIVTTVDTLTSFGAGVIIFAILGHLAHLLKVEVTEVISSGGTRLAFVTYPDVIAKFEAVPWLFSILFFLMLFVLGTGSLLAGHANIYTFIIDFFPELPKFLVSFILAASAFLLGLPYITPGGQFVLTLMDNFGVTFLFFFLTTAEVVAVVWFYGLENFCDDIEFMINRRMGIYWRICWGFITPCVLIVVLFYFLATIERLKNGIYDFPDNVLAIGWCIFGFGVSQPLIWWIVFLIQNRKTGLKNVILESVSFKRWRPSDNDNYNQWVTFKSLIKERKISDGNWLQQKFKDCFNK